MKSILIISLALTSTTLIMLSSCRSTDTDSNLSGGTTSVDINLLGSQFVDESPEAEASVNSKSALTYNGVQRHYTILDPPLYLLPNYLRNLCKSVPEYLRPVRMLLVYL